jgi:molybdate transport system ATP-binding protein
MTLEVALKGGLGALRMDAAFTVPAQGVTALWGPSGAGKTTLLRAIAGLERLEGRVAFEGAAWQGSRHFTPPHRRPIGFVFQDAALLPHLSVRGNLDYALRRAKTPIRTGLDEVVERMGLSALLERASDRLSGGEGRRVAIARALLTQPALLLLDEPLAGLDGSARDEVLERLGRLTATLALPTLLVTHDASEVARLADRALAMRAGRILAAPSPLAPTSAEAAAQALTEADTARRDRLALAALLAGLPPA